MNKKQIEYGMYGLLIGIVAGVIIGISTLNYMNKTERSMMPLFIVGISSIVIGVIGYGKGSSIGKGIYIEQTLGIDKATDSMLQDGRYWIGITKWMDTRNNKQSTLLTARSQAGPLVTELNEELFINHEIKSASKVNVEKHHRQARQAAFDKLRENFSEN